MRTKLDLTTDSSSPMEGFEIKMVYNIAIVNKSAGGSNMRLNQPILVCSLLDNTKLCLLNFGGRLFGGFQLVSLLCESESVGEAKSD